MQELYEKYAGHVVDPKTQAVINKPLEDETGFNEGHQEFLQDVIQKLESGILNPHDQSTLYNREVYDKLEENDQEAADITGQNIMSIIRQIEKLWAIEQKATFQVQNLVETVFQMKSTFEDRYGDVYII